MNQYSLQKKLFLAFIFAIAMAFMESAIVVYLRELYYPLGFQFPLKEIPVFIGLVEIGREMATITMLTTFAMLIAHNKRETFAYFSFSFAIWDIGYYVWLKVIIDWPSSLLDWDILFLIPSPWIGPVLAPLLVSLGLTGAAILILFREKANQPVQMGLWMWLFEIICGLTIIVSFLIVPLQAGIPRRYSWELFLGGFIPGILVFAYTALRSSAGKRRTVRLRE
ncbi:MAG: hypothetical protein E4H13_02660 [Calditrichales bacterium]|nr:MAG: hypothetical protein E4H13_02660 [Calditrichales bacterium]